MAHDQKPPLDPSAQELIRSKLRKLAAKTPFTQQHSEDLEQELYLAVYRGTKKVRLSPERRLAYLTKLIDNRIIDFLRRSYAGKRDYRRLRSLHVLVEEEDGVFVEVGATFGERTHDRRRQRQARPGQGIAELRLDVADVLRRLSPQLRELAEALASKSLPEIARETGVPRSTLQGAVAKLRRIFERANLRDYLDVRRQSRS